ncbi:MAG: RES family NAD+ phosphorylase [bacterium]
MHDSAYAGNQFNPCLGSPTRFAPIHDRHGNCVPALYAGSTLETAIYETIFHDIPAKAKLKTVPRQQVLTRSHTTLVVACDLRLASLRKPDLNTWQVTRNALIASNAKHYGATAAWAEAIHHQFSDIDGLIWTSNQCDPDSAFLLFGDRVDQGDLTVEDCRVGSLDPSLLTDVRIAGKRSGIIITL